MLKQVISSLSLAAGLMLWGLGAAALPNPAALVPGCRCHDAGELTALRQRIAQAPSLDDARELALAPVEQARDALSRARWLAPYSRSISAAEQRLSRYAGGVHRARSEEEVARAFGQLVRLADSGGVVVDASFMQSCHYSTGEIIAIVIGFILGILPGIILLIILC